jgi:hypothetical protein
VHKVRHHTRPGIRIARPVPAPHPRSLIDPSTLDAFGRRYLNARLAVTPRKPIRVFVGVNSAPTPEVRIALAVAELEREGAFQRSRILVTSPISSGHVNPAVLDAEELLSGGDVASVAVQYNTVASFAGVPLVNEAARQYRMLLLAIKRRLDQLYPPGTMRAVHRPKVLAYGESLAAWSAQEAMAGHMHDLGVDRALFVGVPGLSETWYRSEPPGSAHANNLAGVRELMKARGPHGIRALSYSHVDDPVNLISLSTITKKPARNEPWIPLLSFVEDVIDVGISGLPRDPGTPPDSGHEYQTEVAELVRDAFDHGDVDDLRLRRISTVVSKHHQQTLSTSW